MQFYLGTHMVNWVGQLDVPMFVSHRRLRKRKTFPRATAPIAIDSGGFTELSLYGKWETTPQQYAGALQRYVDEIGMVRWAAPQDWMCEPVVRAKTGLSVKEHQARTIGSYEELRALGAPVIPVLQGWAPADYLSHLDQWVKAGHDITQPGVLVGLGSVCRRQATDEIAQLVAELTACRLELHLFGAKVTGLLNMAWAISSSDSMAWSYNARRNPPLVGCTHVHCNNCTLWALRWRLSLLTKIEARYSVWL